jgi:hypothetical protein
VHRTWIVLFLCAPVTWSGNPANEVTVVLDFDQPYSNLSLAEMEREAGAVLRNTGLTFSWKTQDSLAPHQEFKSLFVFKMKGRCEMDVSPVLIDERGPLGMAFVSDGQVLSFGEIECDRVKQSVRRVLPAGKSQKEDRVYGRALGRVVAHEMYHMLSGKTLHSKSGLTQAALTADELTSNHMDLVEIAPAGRLGK